MKVISIVVIAICLLNVGLKAQNEIPTDTVLLFFTNEELKNQSIDRMVVQKLTQITNYAGNTVYVRLYSDADGANKQDVILHSPEKKVFLCPKETDRIFITINPHSSQPAHRIIQRNVKYELFYNKSERLYDIKQED